MILPTSSLESERALLSVGANIIKLLNEPKTISRLWDEIKCLNESYSGRAPFSFDWFILALDLLFALNTIELSEGKIWRANI